MKTKLQLEQLESRLVPTIIDCSVNPVWQAECDYMDNLIPETNITIFATQSGNWSDAQTWGGRLPTNGDIVSIPQGISVKLDYLETDPITAILDKGELNVSTNQNTSLLVGTIVVDETGKFSVGTSDDPIHTDVSANITFLPFTATSSDPSQMSGGLLGHGTVSIYGSEVTPFVAMANAAKSATTFQLLSSVVGWKAGDTLLLPGTSATVNQDEQIKIAAISGNTVTLMTPLLYAHIAPTGHQVYVANEARNIIFQSQSTNSAQYGHIMFMHTDNVEVGYADFINLGRTDKSQVISSTNVRGRYALHFHRDWVNGQTNQDPPIQVKGNFESGSPGWGFVNHSSNVDFLNNVAFNNTGAGFATEAGDEIGSFINNMAVREIGSSDMDGSSNSQARTAAQDFGHAGQGFWLQGASPIVSGNISIGAKDAGFNYYNKGLDQTGLGITQFLVDNLPDPSQANINNPGLSLPPRPSSNPGYIGNYIQCILVPIRFQNNIAYGCAGKPLQINWNDALPGQYSQIDNFHFWGVGGRGMELRPYTFNVIINNVVGIGGSTANLKETGIFFGAGYVRNVVVNNAQISGFGTGCQPPSEGDNYINGGTWDCPTGFFLTPMDNIPRNITFSNITYGPTNTKRMVMGVPVIKTTVPFFPSYFQQDTILLDNGQQLYFTQQMPNEIPFKPGAVTPKTPAVLMGKTSQQLWDQYGLAIDGALAPSNAVYDSVYGGWVGTPATYPPVYSLVGNINQKVNVPYYLQYRRNSDGTVTTETNSSTLVIGWNLLTRIMPDGTKVTFFVQGA